ncbi:MAG: hypothetical protein J7L47_03370 [Candidatus Odinarchaeota archaeon]|nr:hypothetical protein [Candidatus Odinarchaeota archaeon]
MESREKLEREVEFFHRKLKASIDLRATFLKDSIDDLKDRIDTQIKNLGIGPFGEAIKNAYKNAVDEWYKQFLDELQRTLKRGIDERVFRFKETINQVLDSVESQYTAKIDTLEAELREKQSKITELESRIAELEKEISQLKAQLQTQVTSEDKMEE